MRVFLRELKRRHVYKVGVAYLVAAFVVLQLAELAAGAFDLPGWFERVVWILAGLGLPIALVLAWAFELTPEGVERDRGPQAAEAEASAGPVSTSAYRWPVVLSLILMGLLGVGVGGWYLVAAGDVRKATPRSIDRSVAVLPFETMGGADSRHFAEGVHDGLLTRLSNISDLKVISRTSVLAYRGRDMNLPTIADSLGVRWIVEGGVQQAGDQVRVTARLTEAEADAQQWAEIYRRELTAKNLFAVQSELTQKIARSLEAELTSAERERVARRPTEDLEAYRLYVEGRTHLNRRTERSIRRAVDLFERAVTRDSTYALAWSGLADARNLLGFYGHASGGEVQREAFVAARRAVELDPDMAQARASLGLSYEQLRRNGPAAVREYRRAVALEPSYAEARHWLGWLLIVLGQPDAGLEHLRAAADLDPRSPAILTALSQGLWLAKERRDQALDPLWRAQQLEPGYHMAHVVEGLIALESGRQDSARRILDETLDGVEEGSIVWALGLGGLGTAQAHLGDTERAQALLERVEEGGSAPLAEAMLRVAVGEKALALESLERLELRGTHLLYVRYLTWLDPLRDDPRFRRLIRKANSLWGLETDGSLPEGVGSVARRDAD